MGHESPIEPWWAADNRAAWESPNRLASSRQSDENRWQKKPTALRESSSVRDHRTEGQNNPAQRGGLDGKKNSGRRRSLFPLTPFIELIRWDEKAGLQRDAIRSHETTRSRRKKETGNEEE